MLFDLGGSSVPWTQEDCLPRTGSMIKTKNGDCQKQCTDSALLLGFPCCTLCILPRCQLATCPACLLVHMLIMSRTQATTAAILQHVAISCHPLHSQETTYTRHNKTCVTSGGGHGNFLYFPDTGHIPCEMMCSQRCSAKAT